LVLEDDVFLNNENTLLEIDKQYIILIYYVINLLKIELKIISLGIGIELI